MGTTKKDKLTLEMCINRGPNRLVWITYHGNPRVLLKSSIKSRYSIELRYGDTTIIKMGVTLLNIRWVTALNAFAVTFIPNTYYMFSYAATMLRDFSGKKTVKSVLQCFIPESDGTSTIDLSVDDRFESMAIYDHLSYVGQAVDYIAKMAGELETEFYFHSKQFVFGIVSNLKNAEDPDPEKTIWPFNNTFAAFNYRGKQFFTLVSKSPIPAPGSWVSWKGYESRVIYLRITWNKGAADFNAITVKDSFENNDIVVTEETLVGILPRYDSEILRAKIQYSRNINPPFIYQGTDNDDVDLTKNVKCITNSRDMTKIDINGPYDTTVVKGSPYAGETVGVQYPANGGAYGIAVSQHGDRSAAVEVGQMYGVVMPARDSIDDYRLTLPSGITIYGKNSNKTLIMQSKGITILARDNADSQIVPEHRASRLYITPPDEMGSSPIDDAAFISVSVEGGLDNEGVINQKGYVSMYAGNSIYLVVGGKASDVNSSVIIGHADYTDPSTFFRAALAKNTHYHKLPPHWHMTAQGPTIGPPFSDPTAAAPFFPSHVSEPVFEADNVLYTTKKLQAL